MSLALGVPIRTLLAQTSALDLAEYMALERIDGPFGEQRADLRAGIIASTVANHSMSPPKQAMRPVDFMPFARRAVNTIKLANPVEHARLLATTLFGNLVKKKER